MCRPWPLAEQLREPHRHGFEGQFRGRTVLRPSEVRGEDHLGTLGHEELDGGQRCTNAAVVGDDAGSVAFRERNVEVGAYEYAPTSNIQILELLDGHSDVPTSFVRSTSRFE